MAQEGAPTARLARQPPIERRCYALSGPLRLSLEQTRTVMKDFRQAFHAKPLKSLSYFPAQNWMALAFR